MKELFELDWMGGAAEHHFRRARPGIEDLPWGTLDTTKYPPALVDAARATWTEAAFTEYRAVAAFAEVLSAMAEAKAPLDLLGMASGFMADEVVHVELASRMAMELGGATPRPIDFEALVTPAPRELTPFERCNDIVLRVSCVAEAFSGKMAVGSMRSATHPLTRSVLERIVADESLHYRLGGLYFDWASEQMNDNERTRLACVAEETLIALVRGLLGKRDPRSARYRATTEQIGAIGWIETRLYRGQIREAVHDGIIAPLAAYGILLRKDRVDALLA